jgi:hypothetical protein
VDLVSSQGGSDSLIGYRVTALNPARRIVGSDLFGNPELLGETGVISVTGTFSFDTAHQHQLSIYDDEFRTPRNGDSTEFSPRSVLHVMQDIGGLAPADGTVTLSFVDQTFSQIEVPIPEATSFLLMGIGLACLASVRFGGRFRSSERG